MMEAISDINVIDSCILGLPVADALGVPVEFCYRSEHDTDGTHFSLPN